MPEETNAENLGVSVQRFEAGVEVLKRLVDEGKFILFQPRLNWMRIIGDRAEFHTGVAKVESEEAAHRKEANSILSEIRSVLGAVVKFPETGQMLRDYLLKYIFEREADFEEASSEVKDVLNGKIQTVRDKLPVSSLIRRARRLETAGSRCLEDLDVEVIKERRDEIEDIEIDEPFLRLRVRYSDAESQTPFPLFVFAPPGFDVDRGKNLEIECDATDIDLLMRRLVAAKKRLIEANAPEKEEDES